MQINYDAIDDALKDCSSVILTTHETPDGDALGSVIAMNRYLSSVDIASHIILIDAPAPELAFIDSDGLAGTFAGNLPEADLILCLDTASPLRLREMGDAVAASGIPVFTIDHHIPGPDNYPGLVDSSACATGEILYHYLMHRFSAIPGDIAEPLLYAITSDTGWLRFANTNPAVIRICAHLIEQLDKPVNILYGQLYNTWSSERLSLYADVLQTLEIRDGHIAFIHCSQEMFTAYPALTSLSQATETFIDELKRLKECDIQIFLKEKSDGTAFRASMRATGEQGVRDAAVSFGGGGHEMAAGCTITADSIQDAKAQIIKALGKN